MENIAFFHTYVSDEDNVQQALNHSEKLFGNISGVINNAAIQINKPISELTIKEWNRVIAIKVTELLFAPGLLCLQ